MSASMENSSEELSKSLLNKEWLVKIDSATSTPYLIKFSSSATDSSCFVLVTDTKSVWTEALSSKQLARRWRGCNRGSEYLPDLATEDTWRNRLTTLLAKIHTPGGIADMAFEVTTSHYADFAFELEFETCKWRWELCFVGHKTSAEIISKHLIMPLITLTHFAFASADPVSELSAADLEKATDQMGRSARRMMDTHVKHAISKPRVASTMRRVSAMFDFLPELPAIVFDAEPSQLELETLQQRAPAIASPRAFMEDQIPHPPTSHEPEQSGSRIQEPSNLDSATESENEDIAVVPGVAGSSAQYEPYMRSPSPIHPTNLSAGTPSRKISPAPMQPANSVVTKPQTSDSDSSPPRPKKKTKPPVSSDDDSEGERKKRVASLKGVPAPKRGTRQPIKRGGKRF